MLLKVRKFMLLLLLVLFTILGSSLGYSQEMTEQELRDRIEELERENEKLRQTIDEQMELILNIRAEKKQAQNKNKQDIHESTKKSRAKVLDEGWRASVGVINFGLIDSYDHLLNTYGADYNVSGDLYGGRFSIFKGENGIGGSVYLGEYEFTTGNDDDSRQSKQMNERIDIDLAWMHVIEKDDRFQLGSLFGVKWLNTEKELSLREYTTEADFDSETEWKMITGGVFLSYRLSQSHPLYTTGSFNVLLGAVEGTTNDREDDTPDGEINNTYRDESMPAYGFNGTLGLQYVLFKHIALGVGYRGQIMNSTDGFMNMNASFYDGHQSLYAALDIAF